MSKYTELKIALELEMANLSACYAKLRDIFIRNNSPELLSAMELIIDRLKKAEVELDTVIEAQILDEALSISAAPVVRFKLKI